MADQALRNLSPTFVAMYSVMGRLSIPPDWLLKSEILIALYSVRSRRLFCERLLTHETARKFDAVVRHAQRERLLSDEHFTVGGTLIEAWAWLKSVKASTTSMQSDFWERFGS